MIIKDARAAYFSGLINSKKHDPRFLFSTVNTLVNPFPPAISASFDDCEKNYLSFVGKIDGLKSNFQLPVLSPAPFSSPNLLPEFALNSLQTLEHCS